MSKRISPLVDLSVLPTIVPPLIVAFEVILPANTRFPFESPLRTAEPALSLPLHAPLLTVIPVASIIVEPSYISDGCGVHFDSTELSESDRSVAQKLNVALPPT